MNLKSFSYIFVLLGGLGPTLIGASAFGDEPTKPVKITLHPQAAPVPSLKYRLLPDRLSQQRGNAAVYYGKVTAEEIRFFGNEKLRDQIDDWQGTPLEELRGGKVTLPSQGGIEASLRSGALCMECDWLLPIGKAPFFWTLLPEAQQLRGFGRILAARARIQIADREFENAIETLETGYALGRNAATGETIVNGLIGVAICGQMNAQVVEYVQQADAPNLYWALTDLPTPMIDFHRGLEVERMGIELSYPEIAQAQASNKTPEEWRSDFLRIFGKDLIFAVSSGTHPKLPSLEEIESRCNDRLPTAKKRLIADGMSERQVEDMPKFQIATLFSLALCHENTDDAIRYYRLPYPEAIAGIRAVEERIKKEDREIVPVSSELLPAIAVAREAAVRVERTIDVLRVFEALRLYAAAHHGKLPDSLTSVAEVPIPNDPVTGKAFEYKLADGLAMLRGPVLTGQPLDYEITMAAEK